jgi:hypothetical protein
VDEQGLRIPTEICSFLINRKTDIEQSDLEVSAAIENAFDEHRIRRRDEGKGHAPLESGHPQSAQQIVALRSPQRKCGETVGGINSEGSCTSAGYSTKFGCSIRKTPSTEAKGSVPGFDGAWCRLSN